jgi:2-methylcitrate dehydratase PrpD
MFIENWKEGAYNIASTKNTESRIFGGNTMDRTSDMLSSFACGLNYEDLTPQTVHQVKRVLVDTLACAMGGYLSEPAKIARHLASTVSSTVPSHIWGTKDYSSLEMAGFANSVMVRYLDYNDMSVGGHPSDSIPGPLAMADALKSDGRAIITSIVVNYEVARRVGDHVQHAFQMGWDHGILFEPFDGSEGLWAKMLNHSVQLEDGWGEPYSINDTRLKFFPSQGGTQGPTGLAVELHSQVSPSEIKAIHIQLPEGLFCRAVSEPEKWNPQTRETADHSIPYLVAVALQDGAVTPASFSPQRIHDPALRSLIERMTVDAEPEFSCRYPDEINCRIEITTTLGEQRVAQTAYPKGHPRNPMSDAEINSKFRSLTTELLTTQQCDQALDLLWSLEDQPSLEELYDNLVI